MLFAFVYSVLHLLLDVVDVRLRVCDLEASLWTDSEFSIPVPLSWIERGTGASLAT